MSVTGFLLFLLPRTGYPLGSVVIPVGDNTYIYKVSLCITILFYQVIVEYKCSKYD